MHTIKEGTLKAVNTVAGKFTAGVMLEGCRKMEEKTLRNEDEKQKSKEYHPNVN